MRERPNDRVAILAYDDLRTFEFGIAVELFALDRPEIDRYYETLVVGVVPGPLRATGGLIVNPGHDLAAARGAGTLIVPGWCDVEGPLAPAVLDLLQTCVADPAVASLVARRMVMPPHREGGQGQYIQRPPDPPSDGWVGRVQEWVLATIDRPHSIADLADQAGYSPRTFARRFSAATGTSPGVWLIRQRLSRAQELLVSSDLPIDRVATAVGFGSAVTLRHHFRSVLATTPTAYRRRFRSAG